MVKKILTYSALIFLVFHLHQTETSATNQINFLDVNEGDRFEEYIADLVNREIISGFPDGTFKPDHAVKRNEAAIMIGRYLTLDKTFTSSSFSDVNDNVTGAGYIESAMTAGIISGYGDGTFRPRLQISRAEMAIILDRTFSMEQSDIPFDDVDDSIQAYGAIQALYGSGITEGYPDNTFRPDQTITRGEFAAFMTRAINWEESAEERKYQEMIVEVEALIRELPDDTETAQREEIEKIRALLNDIQLNGYSIDETLKQQFVEAEQDFNLQIESIREDVIGKLDSDYDSGHFYERTMDYHGLFSVNANQGNIDAENETVFVEGDPDQSILVTVPHGVEHIRNDEAKYAEVYTGPMGLLLNEYTGVHVLYQAKTGRDPNFYNDVEFKERLAEIVEDYDISLILDLHGMSDRPDLDISLDIGTNHGRIISPEVVNSLVYYYAANDVNNVWQNKLFSASNPANIAHYSFHELNVPAMQLEYTRSMRNPRNQLPAFYNNIRSLIGFILEYQSRENEVQ